MGLLTNQISSFARNWPKDQNWAACLNTASDPLSEMKTCMTSKILCLMTLNGPQVKLSALFVPERAIVALQQGSMTLFYYLCLDLYCVYVFVKLSNKINKPLTRGEVTGVCCG
jgi:hypothetical protein